MSNGKPMWYGVIERKKRHVDYPRIAHVIPLGDLREHEKTHACWCTPKMLSHDGGTLVIHQALDGRPQPKTV
jgi:hypothetical protein